MLAIQLFCLFQEGDHDAPYLATASDYVIFYTDLIYYAGITSRTGTIRHSINLPIQPDISDHNSKTDVTYDIMQSDTYTKLYWAALNRKSKNGSLHVLILDIWPEKIDIVHRNAGK